MSLTPIQVVTFVLAVCAQATRILPATKPFWAKLPAVVQIWLPPLVPFVAALQASIAGAQTWTDLVVVGFGCAALIVPGAPSNRSSAPLQAAKPFIPPPMGPMGGMMLIACLVLSLPGCAWFSSKLPVAEQCLPTPASLAAQVAAILADGGDYVAKLEALAVTDGEAVIVCAVQAFLSPGKPAASEESAASHERAKAYLKLKGAQ